MSDEKKPELEPQPVKTIKRLGEQVRVVEAGHPALTTPDESAGEAAITLNGICK